MWSNDGLLMDASNFRTQASFKLYCSAGTTHDATFDFHKISLLPVGGRITLPLQNGTICPASYLHLKTIRFRCFNSHVGLCWYRNNVHGGSLRLCSLCSDSYACNSFVSN